MARTSFPVCRSSFSNALCGSASCREGAAHALIDLALPHHERLRLGASEANRCLALSEAKLLQIVTPQMPVKKEHRSEASPLAFLRQGYPLLGVRRTRHPHRLSGGYYPSPGTVARHGGLGGEHHVWR